MVVFYATSCTASTLSQNFPFVNAVNRTITHFKREKT
nr:MAG TPA: GRX-like domain protein [Caudoviricetes sp.]